MKPPAMFETHFQTKKAWDYHVCREYILSGELRVPLHSFTGQSASIFRFHQECLIRFEISFRVTQVLKFAPKPLDPPPDEKFEGAAIGVVVQHSPGEAKHHGGNVKKR